MHPLPEALLAAADGTFPPTDGRVEVLAPLDGDHHGVVEFTGHSVVLTECAVEELRARGADGFGGSSHPDVVRWLAGPDGWIGSHDVVLAARGTGGGRLSESRIHETHPRVVRSRAHRRDVRVYADDAGVVTLGRGLVDRQELSVELFEPGVSGGQGRALITRGSRTGRTGSGPVRTGRSWEFGVNQGVSELWIRRDRSRNVAQTADQVTP